MHFISYVQCFRDVETVLQFLYCCCYYGYVPHIYHFLLKMCEEVTNTDQNTAFKYIFLTEMYYLKWNIRWALTVLTLISQCGGHGVSMGKMLAVYGTVKLETDQRAHADPMPIATLKPPHGFKVVTGVYIGNNCSKVSLDLIIYLHHYFNSE